MPRRMGKAWKSQAGTPGFETFMATTVLYKVKLVYSPFQNDKHTDGGVSLQTQVQGSRLV